MDGQGGFIFGTRFHGTQHQGTLNKVIRRIVKEANGQKNAAVMIQYFSCHTLRRTYATNLARAGVSIPVTMALMGHGQYIILKTRINALCGCGYKKTVIIRAQSTVAYIKYYKRIKRCSL